MASQAAMLALEDSSSAAREECSLIPPQASWEVVVTGASMAFVKVATAVLAAVVSFVPYQFARSSRHRTRCTL